MNQLVAAFAAATLKAPAVKQGNKRRRRRRRPNQNTTSQPAVPAAEVKKIPRKIAGTIEGDGSAVISRTELLTQVKGAGGSVKALVTLHPDSLPWLQKISPGYASIIWLSVKIYWKPAVGTSTNGSVVFGMDWGRDFSDANKVDRAKVQALSPMAEMPVWQAGKTLTLPSAKLMSRKYYDLSSTVKSTQDGSPGNVAVVCQADSSASEKFYGDIWITYKVKLLNPQAS